MTKPHILIVDDDPSLRSSTRLILKHHGYEVTEARNGEEAVELAQEGPFSLVLMDIRMPGMSGIEVFEQLESEGNATKVLFMTAYAMDDDVVRALAAGAVGVLRKPVEVEQLLSLVQEHCSDTLEVAP